MPIDSQLAWIGALAALLATPDAAPRQADVSAVLIQIEGQVTLRPKTREKFNSVRLAARRQIVRQGERIYLPAGAHATAICSTERLIKLVGPCEWIVHGTSCEQGLTLPESSYRNLTAYGGRILPRHGVLLLEFEPRSVDGLGAMLLSPRHTALADSRPTLVWTQVPEALEYSIKVRGPAQFSIWLPATTLTCGPGAPPWQGLNICTWKPSAQWPELMPGKQISLELGYRRHRNATPSPISGISLIHLLSVEDRDRLRSEQEGISALMLEPIDHLLLKAGSYLRHGLLTDAIAAYDEALLSQDIPEIRVTLGDLYLTVGLTALAEREYRRVLAGSPVAATQAAAELGLGYVRYFRKDFADARKLFERARERYMVLGMAAEAEDAGGAAARC